MLISCICKCLFCFLENKAHIIKKLLKKMRKTKYRVQKYHCGFLQWWLILPLKCQLKCHLPPAHL